ncbi:hypothetical protein NT2_01_04290 [Caenibius tardaugens NBRC 16725]|uniref:Short chain dehydrogenase-like proteobacteria domain-containing protein n=1 Tax=Caenibius tardaugens NBRC 16725 TaxID=1219035 RepID=U2ZYQ6_9SPHN|nr:hypothetical protein [Caenibius tardaugens]AZI37105.1 hypothetical protein EGO55_14985 [Caenibius tardaugens NBRC 16725]GAD47658.1 hypothetical protein NT2_01_04290 [Caenibius tardaugens NBRC 16725]
MQAVYRIGGLPEGAPHASAAFHADHAAAIADRLADAPESLVIVFPRASYDHRGWRRAAIADLARAHAPVRVNGLVDGDPAAMARTLAFLEMAKGVTGQLLAVDGAAA